MDFKIAWSPEAVEDLDSIANYISRDSEFYAKAVVTKIIEMSHSIKNTPLAGRIVPEFGNKHIRERFVYSYRLVYQVESHKILILAIIHGKRLIEKISQRL